MVAGNAYALVDTIQGELPEVNKERCPALWYGNRMACCVWKRRENLRMPLFRKVQLTRQSCWQTIFAGIHF